MIPRPLDSPLSLVSFTNIQYQHGKQLENLYKMENDNDNMRTMLYNGGEIKMKYDVEGVAGIVYIQLGPL